MTASEETPIQKEAHSPSTSTSATLNTQNQPQSQHSQVKSTAPTPTPGTTTTTAGLTTQSGASSIELISRHDLSLLYRFLRLILKPLRPHLVRPAKEPQPGGSPRLDPWRKRNIEITETKAEGVWMYHFCALGPGSGKNGSVVKAHETDMNTIANGDGGADVADGKLNKTNGADIHKPQGSTKGRGSQRRHCVYYFSGGGFQSPPSSEHWRFLAQLAQDLAGHRSSVTFPGSKRSVDPVSDAKIELILVSYPLAPKSPARESLRVLKIWLNRVMDEAVEKGETLSLVGDSSGGNVAVCLGFWAVENYDTALAAAAGQDAHSQTDVKDKGDEGEDKVRPEALRTTSFPLTSLMSISGPMDLTNSNPEVQRADKLDCVLTAKLTKQVAEAWTGHDKSRPSQHEPIPLSDPTVSPLLNTDSAFKALRDRRVNVHGVYGTHDVLTPSGMDFMRKCQRIGVKGRWLVWEGQMHCFPLAAGGDRLGIREGREARKFVETVLKGDAEQED